MLLFCKIGVDGDSLLILVELSFLSLYATRLCFLSQVYMSFTTITIRSYWCVPSYLLRMHTASNIVLFPSLKKPPHSPIIAQQYCATLSHSSFHFNKCLLVLCWFSVFKRLLISKQLQTVKNTSDKPSVYLSQII